MENTYNDKPKFDPNKPFQEIKEPKPKFDPTQKFEVVAEAPKKKDGGIGSALGVAVGKQLASAPPSTSSRPKTISQGVEKDKEGSSVVGGLYNSIVGSISRAVGGLAELSAMHDPIAKHIPSGYGWTAREQITKFIDKARTSSSSKENEQKLTSFDFTDGVDWSDVGGVLAGAPSMATDIGLGAVSGGGTFFVQAVNDAAKDLDENPEAKNLSPNQKMGYVLTQASVQAALEKVALDKIFKGTGITKQVKQKIASEIVDEFAKKGIKATTEQIEKAALKKATSFASKIKNVGVKAATGFGVESGTEGLQKAGSEGIKLLTNKLKGNEIFDEEDIKTNFAKNVINSAVGGGILGGVAGGGVGTLQNTNKSIRNEIANGTDYAQIQQQLAEQVELGNITSEEAESASITAQQYAEIASKIPDDIDAEKKYAIIGGISQREGLAKEIEIAKEEILKVDPAFRRERLDKLDLLEAKLAQTNDYIEGLVLDKKPEYKKEGDAHIKTDGEGNKTEISKEHFDLASVIKEPEPETPTTQPQPIEPILEGDGVEGNNVPSDSNVASPVASHTSGVGNSVGNGGLISKPIDVLEDKEAVAGKYKDTKVVDDSGKPKEVYHGTWSDAPFEDFKEGDTYFTDNYDTAKMFGINREGGVEMENMDLQKKPFVMEVEDSSGKKIKMVIAHTDMSSIFSDLNYDVSPVGKWGKEDLEAFDADSIEHHFGISPDEIKSFSIEERKVGKGVDDNGVSKHYINLKNPLIIDAKGDLWNGSKGGDIQGKINEAREGGKHDGVIVKNIVEGGLSNPDTKPTTTYVVFNKKPNKEQNQEPSVATDDAILTNPDNQNKNDEKPDNIGSANDTQINDGQGINESEGGMRADNVSGENGNGEPPSSTGASQVSEADMTGITHAQMNETAKEFGLEEYQEDPETIEEWNEQAKEKISKDPTSVDKLLDKLRNGYQPDKVEQRMMAFYIADLKAKIKITPSDDLLTQLKRAKDLSNIMGGREVAKSLRARRDLIPVEKSLPDEYVARMEAAGVDVLTPEQKKDVEEKFADYERKQKEADEKIKDLEEKSQRLEAELAIARARKDTKKTGKKDFKKEREDIKASIREKLKQSRGQANDVVNAVVDFAKIAPDVVKLMKSYLQEGVATLSDIVTKINEDVPELDKKDIVDILAGKYDSQETKLDLLTRLKNIKDKNSAEAIKIKAKLEIGDFKKKPKARSVFDSEELKKMYPKEFAASLDAVVAKEKAKHELELANLREEMKNRTGLQKARGAVLKTLRTAKALKAGIDFSATLVQNLLAIAANPIVGWKGLVTSFKDFGSAQRFERELARMHSSEWWPLIEKSGLAVLDPKSLRESEKSDIYNDTFFDNMKIKGKSIAPTKPFERQFTSLGNFIRVNLFLRKAQELMEGENPKTFETHPEEFKSLAAVINNMTGRGTMAKSLELNNELLSSVLWSPRLLASTLNILGVGEFSGKGFYRSLTPAQRKYAASQIGRGVAMGIAVMAAIGIAGEGEPDLDPTSVTFGTVKIDGYRYTVFGRFNSVVRTLAMIMARKKKTSKGEDDLMDRRGSSVEGEAVKFFRGKANPTLGIGWNMVTGKDYSGKPITIEGELTNALYPMSVDEIVTGVKQDKLNGLLIRGLPSIFGAKVTNEKDFPKTPPKKQQSGRQERKFIKRNNSE
jgi:hypothetical protein